MARRIVAVMRTLNRAAAEAMLETGVSACTDVTGFGLLGHLREMAAASGLDAEVEAAAVPVIEPARELAAADVVPGGTLENLAHVSPHVDFAPGLSRVDQAPPRRRADLRRPPDRRPGRALRRAPRRAPGEGRPRGPPDRALHRAGAGEDPRRLRRRSSQRTRHVPARRVDPEGRPASPDLGLEAVLGPLRHPRPGKALGVDVAARGRDRQRQGGGGGEREVHVAAGRLDLAARELRGVEGERHLPAAGLDLQALDLPQAAPVDVARARLEVERPGHVVEGDVARARARPRPSAPRTGPASRLPTPWRC